MPLAEIRATERKFIVKMLESQGFAVTGEHIERDWYKLSLSFSNTPAYIDIFGPGHFEGAVRLDFMRLIHVSLGFGQRDLDATRWNILDQYELPVQLAGSGRGTVVATSFTINNFLNAEVMSTFRSFLELSRWTFLSNISSGSQVFFTEQPIERSATKVFSDERSEHVLTELEKVSPIPPATLFRVVSFVNTTSIGSPDDGGITLTTARRSFPSVTYYLAKHTSQDFWAKSFWLRASSSVHDLSFKFGFHTLDLPRSAAQQFLLLPGHWVSVDISGGKTSIASIPQWRLEERSPESVRWMVSSQEVEENRLDSWLGRLEMVLSDAKAGPYR